jgi:hypothetical protein
MTFAFGVGDRLARTREYLYGTRTTRDFIDCLCTWGSFRSRHLIIIPKNKKETDYMNPKERNKAVI